MLVLDALFDRIQQTSSNIEIVASLVQCSPISAIDVRVGSFASDRNASDPRGMSALPPKAGLQSAHQ
jgi:hypothetical protein